MEEPDRPPRKIYAMLSKLPPTTLPVPAMLIKSNARTEQLPASVDLVTGANSGLLRKGERAARRDPAAEVLVWELDMVS